jgi:hypothetical protein
VLRRLPTARHTHARCSGGGVVQALNFPLPNRAPAMLAGAPAAERCDAHLQDLLDS